MVNQERRLSIIVGLLFFTTVLAGLFISAVATPLLSSSFESIRSNKGILLTGAFLNLAMAIGVVGIALGFYPVVRRKNWGMAASYLCFRIIECLLLLAGTIVPLLVIELSQSSLSMSANDGLGLTFAARTAVQIALDSFQVSMVILGFNSVGLFIVLFKHEILPRWLSFMAIIGYVLLGTSGVLVLCGILDTKGTGALFYLIGGIVELILLPFWLITRGFVPKKN